MAAFRDDVGVIVSEPYAFRRGLSVGDSVMLGGSGGRD